MHHADNSLMFSIQVVKSDLGRSHQLRESGRALQLWIGAIDFQHVD